MASQTQTFEVIDRTTAFVMATFKSAGEAADYCDDMNDRSGRNYIVVQVA